MVGVFMMDSIRKIEFDDVTETLPVFATILFMVLRLFNCRRYGIGYDELRHIEITYRQI